MPRPPRQPPGLQPPARPRPHGGHGRSGADAAAGDTDPAHRRFDHRRDRRAPSDARHQAHRAEARRHLRRLAHARAPGAEPVEPRPAGHARARARRPRRHAERRRSAPGVRGAPDDRSGDGPQLCGAITTAQVAELRAHLRAERRRCLRTDVPRPHAPARRLPRGAATHARQPRAGGGCWRPAVAARRGNVSHDPAPGVAAQLAR